MPTAVLTDHELVADFRAGDDDAFDEVVRRYGEPLVRYARQQLRDASPDAEDVVQESLARAFSALRRDDRPMLLRPWLYRIVSNGIVDTLRSPSYDPLDDAATSVGDTLDDVLARHELTALVSAVASLPERQRRALVLRVFEGRTYRAIAAELQTSIPATKALIARARRGLRHTPLADAA